MKHRLNSCHPYNPQVTLHARVWIETGYLCGVVISGTVTLHARVWIETDFEFGRFDGVLCHPPREGVD